MDFLFVMDPAEGMLPTKDTSFAFARGALARGHRCFHCGPTDLDPATSEDGGYEVKVRCRSLIVSDEAPHVSLGDVEERDAAQLDAVLIRKDPPFDTVYLHLTQTLDLIKDRCLILNDPAALRDANEKLYALKFSRWMPRTLVTRSTDAIHAFLSEVGGKAVLKPLDGAGGAGVVMLTEGDKNVRALVDLLTHEGREQAMVQEFRPEVVGGDKRVLLLDGKLLGAIRRVPQADDIRANIHVGGRVEATELTKQEQELVDEVGPLLAAAGLYFVGLDLIGGALIEVNVTSPTGVQELARLTQSKPEETFIEWVEQKAQTVKQLATVADQSVG